MAYPRINTEKKEGLPLMPKGKRGKNSNYQVNKTINVTPEYARKQERRDNLAHTLNKCLPLAFGIALTIIAIAAIIHITTPEPTGPFRFTAATPDGTEDIFLSDLDTPWVYSKQLELQETNEFDMTKTLLTAKTSDLPRSYIKQLKDGMNGEKYSAVIQDPHAEAPFEGRLSGLYRDDNNNVAIIIGDDLYITGDINVAIKFE